MDFATFFELATARLPFPYQPRLAEAAHTPHLLAVPTGAGKTAAAVLGWLWRRREADPVVRAATPRRLVFCLPMRTLVEQTASVSRTWIERLGLTDQVGVHELLGGAVDRSWEGHPDREAILVGTQDQLLSRALNRGYAMSRYAWPVHFGLLHNDCLWVLDEVQLMGVGLSTSAQLHAFREMSGVAEPCASLWMSATLDRTRLDTVDLRGRELRSLGIAQADRDCPELARRLSARKQLERVDVPHDDLRGLAALIGDVHVAGTRTIVVVNRVGRAQALFDALRGAARTTRSALLHSRFRPLERGRIQAEVLAPDWTGILVATQAVEAGVDVSSRTLVTDLAPWSSLVQRFGRCNRAGEVTGDGGRVLWIDLPDDAAAPYASDDLAESRNLLGGLGEVGPDRLDVVKARASGPALPVIRLRDLRDLFDTQPDLAGHDLDVSRYIRDADETDVQVAWRSWEGDRPARESPALSQVELCRVPIGALRPFVKGRSVFRWNGNERDWEVVRSVVPGTAVVVPVEAGGYSPDLGWTSNPKHRITSAEPPSPPADSDEADPLTFGCHRYVTLAEHSLDVVDELRKLRDTLSAAHPWRSLELAAQWHDLGKAHESFQTMLVSGLPEDDPRRNQGPWAKSDGRPGQRNERRHFRHELASALALLDHHADSLAAYLTAAHHGKVRVSIRSRPTERSPQDGRPFALGIWDGDRVPAVDLGQGVRTHEVTLRLAPVQLGGDDDAPSWLERTLTLLEAHGPFRLAYWEALVRVADWRGTARHRVVAAEGVSS